MFCNLIVTVFILTNPPTFWQSIVPQHLPHADYLGVLNCHIKIWIGADGRVHYMYIWSTVNNLITEDLGQPGDNSSQAVQANAPQLEHQGDGSLADLQDGSEDSDNEGGVPV